jgi:hypothetical protein
VTRRTTSAPRRHPVSTKTTQWGQLDRSPWRYRPFERDRGHSSPVTRFQAARLQGEAARLRVGVAL